MARRREAVVEPEVPPTEVLDGLVPTVEPERPAAPGVPTYGSVEWTPYVMGQFEPDELVDGLPTSDGLRRVCEAVLGPILVSDIQVWQAPNLHNDNHTVATARVTVRLDRVDGSLRTFCGTCDVGRFNKPVGDKDAKFAYQFSAATAETRAKGRAYKEALRLRHVYTIEEVSRGNEEELGVSISPTQVNAMDVVGKRLGLNIWKWLNTGRNKYERLQDVPHAVAVKAWANLNTLQREPESIPEPLRGYDPNWKNG